jgi:hypothetical protein
MILGRGILCSGHDCYVVNLSTRVSRLLVQLGVAFPKSISAMRDIKHSDVMVSAGFNPSATSW